MREFGSEEEAAQASQVSEERFTAARNKAVENEFAPEALKRIQAVERGVVKNEAKMAISKRSVGALNEGLKNISTLETGRILFGDIDGFEEATDSLELEQRLRFVHPEVRDAIKDDFFNIRDKAGKKSLSSYDALAHMLGFGGSYNKPEINRMKNIQEVLDTTQQLIETQYFNGAIGEELLSTTLGKYGLSPIQLLEIIQGPASPFKKQIEEYMGTTRDSLVRRESSKGAQKLTEKEARYERKIDEAKGLKETDPEAFAKEYGEGGDLEISQQADQEVFGTTKGRNLVLLDQKAGELEDFLVSAGVDYKDPSTTILDVPKEDYYELKKKTTKLYEISQSKLSTSDKQKLYHLTDVAGHAAFAALVKKGTVGVIDKHIADVDRILGTEFSDVAKGIGLEAVISYQAVFNALLHNFGGGAMTVHEAKNFSGQLSSLANSYPAVIAALKQNVIGTLSSIRNLSQAVHPLLHKFSQTNVAEQRLTLTVQFLDELATNNKQAASRIISESAKVSRNDTAREQFTKDISKFSSYALGK